MSSKGQHLISLLSELKEKWSCYPDAPDPSKKQKPLPILNLNGRVQLFHVDGKNSLNKTAKHGTPRF